MTDVGQSSSSAPDQVVRRGRVSWLTHPPHGEARIGVESRAFGATPVALPEGDPVPGEATPGELLAVTHATFMAAALSAVLVEAGSPANELVVSADCTFAGPLPERELVAVDLRVHGRVPGLEAGSFDAAVAVAHRRYLRSCGLRANIPGELRAVLQHAGVRAQVHLLDLPADVGACLFHGDGVLTHTARVDGIVPDSEHLDGKPVPDTFLEGAGVLGVEPREAAVVEDAPAWVAAGRARRFGGAVPVDRADQADALRRQGGDVVVSDVVELLERP